MSETPQPPPALSSRLGRVGRSVYSQLLDRLSSYKGEVYPFHVGDTYLPPAVPPGDPAISEEREITSHRYTPVSGAPAVLESARQWLSARQGVEVSSDEVLVVGGGTAGVSALVATLLSPGDELMILAPYWPLVAGATRMHGGKPVAVPFFQEELSLGAAIARLDEYVTPRARALYINTPNNPTGEVLSDEWLEAIIDWAARRGLWVISDEVYDLFNYQRPHRYARPLDPTRVISVFSMSKAFGMAGYRCGILQGPSEVMRAAERVLTHALYSAATPAQLAAREAMSERGLAWARAASIEYQRVGEEVARRLGVSAPQGSTFLFLDMSAVVGPTGRYACERGDVSALLEACVERGLLLAPGSAFGPYPQHVRLCFTAAAPDVVYRGVDALLELIRP